MSEVVKPEGTKAANFIRNIIAEDLRSGKHKTTVTRFPPEPNGYLHIGHAKSICLNFGTAEENPGGVCFLRFDDTNPETEEVEFIDSIKADVRWLGFDWGQNLTYASDYFEQLYNYAVDLIKSGNAYVCSLTAEQMREYRGTLTQPGKESPDRQRSVAENLDLFMRMRQGEFKDGALVLRAKLDMNSGNINLRDPVMYRIKHMEHPKTGTAWCIYPMYDYTHCVSDALEKITHSLCTLEFEDHRPLYDWFLKELKTPCHPRQIEFARLNLNYTITSKRKLKILVEKGFVDGWNDPRMPTLVGVRRRGFTPRGIRNFCEMTGLSKSNSVIDMSVLEECVRNDLNNTAARAMAVLRPLRLVIENLPDETIELDVANHPGNPAMGSRKMPFSNVVYIEQDDFLENPPKDFFRLGPGKEVRLRYSYVIKCEKVIKDPQTGAVVELRCSADLNTLGKQPEGRKVKGIVHWVAAAHALKAEVRLYDRLFNVANPAAEKDEEFTKHLNPTSLETIAEALVEPALAGAKPETHFQFERLGYFVVDQLDGGERLVFNRTVTLRDSWSKPGS